MTLIDYKTLERDAGGKPVAIPVFTGDMLFLIPLQPPNISTNSGEGVARCNPI
jgi:hypothetical protein